MTKKAEVSVVDELADDAVPPEYPAGAPVLLPYLQIRPRSRRAEFKRKYAGFADLQKKVKELQAAAGDDNEVDAPEKVADRMRLWADMDDLYQQMAELMEMAAVNPEHYREWVDKAEDSELTAVFNVFMRRGQPGEASSSAS